MTEINLILDKLIQFGLDDATKDKIKLNYALKILEQIEQ